MAAHMKTATGLSTISASTVVVNDDQLSPSTLSDFTGMPIVSSPDGTLSSKPTPAREPTLDPRSVSRFIPPEHNNRTLVLCFDGTGDQFDADNSNIVQLVSLLKKDDRTQQMVYYQAGIGTYMSPKIATPFVSNISKKLDTMFAWHLDAHVMSGYEFLMQNYIVGDKICIFGFSRGAYTARSLAGMLHKVGLLPANNFQQVPFAYKMYTRADHVGWEQSNEFKKAFSVDVQIDFLGVWDTVDSVGIIPRRLPFTTSNTIVRTFRHAISLDERRAKFKANLWNRPNSEEVKLGVAKPHHVNVAPAQQHEKKHMVRSLTSDSKELHDEVVLDHLEKMFSEQHEQETDVEEVWFAGCHCDVGGGSVSNKTRNSLARIPLRWIVRECFKANTGMMFDSNALRGIGLDPTTLYPFVTPRPPLLSIRDNRIAKHPSKEIPVRIHARLLKKNKHPDLYTGSREQLAPAVMGTEEEEELEDALSPVYDQLKIKRSWWILEVLPLHLRYQKGDNNWVCKFVCNLAQPRFIPKQQANGVKIHRSVKLRMDAEYEDIKRKGKKYKTRAKLTVEPTWVD